MHALKAAADLDVGAASVEGDALADEEDGAGDFALRVCTGMGASVGVSW